MKRLLLWVLWVLSNLEGYAQEIPKCEGLTSWETVVVSSIRKSYLTTRSLEPVMYDNRTGKIYVPTDVLNCSVTQHSSGIMIGPYLVVLPKKGVVNRFNITIYVNKEPYMASVAAQTKDLLLLVTTYKGKESKLRVGYPDFTFEVLSFNSKNKPFPPQNISISGMQMTELVNSSAKCYPKNEHKFKNQQLPQEPKLIDKASPYMVCF